MTDGTGGGLVVALLAAGQSSRFGAANKLAAILGDRALINWSAGAGATINGARRFLVTTGRDAGAGIGAGYEGLINPDAAEGLASSLRLAAQAASRSGAEKLLVLLADMPFVTGDHLQRLLAAGDADPARPVFSQAPDGVAQPPALFPAAYFARLAAMSGDSGARQFARDAMIVEADTALLIDVDTPADLERAQVILAAKAR